MNLDYFVGPLWRPLVTRYVMELAKIRDSEAILGYLT